MQIGTAALCYQMTGATSGLFNCGNFVDPRTFSINGTSFDCVPTGEGTLPATRNGGWCIQVGAGNEAWAWFGTYNVN